MQYVQSASMLLLTLLETEHLCIPHHLLSPPPTPYTLAPHRLVCLVHCTAGAPYRTLSDSSCAAQSRSRMDSADGHRSLLSASASGEEAASGIRHSITALSSVSERDQSETMAKAQAWESETAQIDGAHAKTSDEGGPRGGGRPGATPSPATT